MFCSNCGQRLADDAKHCPNCGMAVEPENAGAQPYTEAAGPAPAAPETAHAAYTAPAPEAPKAAAPAPSYTQTYSAPAASGLPAKAPEAPADKQALTGFILSLVSLVCCCAPCFGLVLSITGLIFSIKGLKSQARHAMAVIGLIVSILAILMAVFSFISSWMLVTDSGGVEGFMEDFMESIGWGDFGY